MKTDKELAVELMCSYLHSLSQLKLQTGKSAFALPDYDTTIKVVENWTNKLNQINSFQN